MKSIIERNKEILFPKLMVSDVNVIVLFSAPNKGVVVHSPSVVDIGMYGVNFTMSEFEDYYGSVTLSNI